MEKNYKEIKFEWGISLEEAVTELLRRRDNRELVCGNFNYTMLYSDTVTMDNAYLAVHGKTKKEFDAFVSKNRQKMYGSAIQSENQTEPENEKDLANKNLVKEWVEKGRAILDEKYWDKWEECVPIRLDDLYHGMELGACLEIVDALNKGCTLEEAKDIIYAQNHSGMSYSLVRAMVKAFCDRGAKFSDYTKL